MQSVKSTNCKVNLVLLWGLNTGDFAQCGTMLRAKSSLHWTAIHYQVTFE